MSGMQLRLLCADPAATMAFYEAAFGQTFAIEFAPTPARRSDPPASNDTRFQHFAIIVSDMAAAMARLRSVPSWTPISRAGPELLPASSGGVTAFKFRDPDGHALELLQFPPDAVPPAWHDVPGLFLGIDHTAITVTDMQRAIIFYERLGFTVAHRSINRGQEQARMDDVDDPVVEVTGLTPPGGGPPHLELLCYRQPPTLRQAATAHDILATRMVLTKAAGQPPGDRTDPDGHRVEVTSGLTPT